MGKSHLCDSIFNQFLCAKYFAISNWHREDSSGQTADLLQFAILWEMKGRVGFLSLTSSFSY